MKLVGALLLSLACSAAVAQDAFPFSEVTLKNGFGTRAQEPNLYSLMGNGQIRALRSDEEMAIVTEWRARHPHALAVPVSLMGGMKMMYIWAVDGDASLNLTLIEKGVYPATVMIDAVQFLQLSQSAPDTPQTAAVKAGYAYGQRLSGTPTPKDVPPQRFVSRDRYNKFLKQLIAAENRALAQRSGIWSAHYDDLRAQENVVPLSQVPPAVLGLR